MNKPTKGNLYHANIPPDENDPKKLRGDHPVIITDNNDDDTSRFIGCTSKNKFNNNVEVKTDNPKINTTAKVTDGERDIENNKLNKWNGKDIKVTNIEEIIEITRRIK